MRLTINAVAFQINVYTEDRRVINAFLGVPYASPPIGNLRFAVSNFRHWDDPKKCRRCNFDRLAVYAATQ